MAIGMYRDRHEASDQLSLCGRNMRATELFAQRIDSEFPHGVTKGRWLFDLR